MKYAKVLLGVSVALNLVLLFNYILIRQNHLTRVVSEYEQHSDAKVKTADVLSELESVAVDKVMPLRKPGKAIADTKPKSPEFDVVNVDKVAEELGVHDVEEHIEKVTKPSYIATNKPPVAHIVTNIPRVAHIATNKPPAAERTHRPVKISRGEAIKTQHIPPDRRDERTPLRRPPPKHAYKDPRGSRQRIPENQKKFNVDDEIPNLQHDNQISEHNMHLDSRGMSRNENNQNINQRNPNSRSNRQENNRQNVRHEANQRTDNLKVYNWNGQGWVTNQTVCSKRQHFVKASLQTRNGNTPIYVHDPKQDKYISESLIRTGSWEPEVSNAVLNALNTDPSLSLLDIGANIGVVSLHAAKIGRHVISIEPLRANVQRLCSSYRDGRFGDRVAVILNAISDKHEIVSLGRDLNNIGGTFVINENPNKANGYDVSFDGAYKENIRTILLDDLLTLFSPDALNKVVIKMDVEGYEDHVLKGANRFFENVNVRAIIMEWTYSKQQSTAGYIEQFLYKHKMIPYDISMTRNLGSTRSQTWPNNVVWINSDYQGALG